MAVAGDFPVEIVDEFLGARWLHSTCWLRSNGRHALRNYAPERYETACERYETCYNSGVALRNPGGVNEQVARADGQEEAGAKSCDP
jgi:hypothetical protein